MKFSLFVVLGLAALGVGLETQALVRARERLAAEKSRLVRLEAQQRTTREQRDERAAAEHAAEEKRAGLQVVAAAREARNAQAVAWRDRIKTLQQRLDELPEKKIPELKLLHMKDWVEAVLYADTTTDAQVLTALRTRARARFAALLPDALRRFTDASGGELPHDVLDLLPYLAAPADAAMLGGYTLRRSGKIGARDEELLVANPSEEDSETISVKLGGYSFKTHPEGADAGAAVDTLTESIGTEALGSSDNFGMKSQVASLEAAGPALEKSFGSLDGAFGNRLKSAVKQYADANAGRPPADMSQLRGYLPDYDQLAANMHEAMAQIEYLMDHGEPAGDPSQLRRYLEHSVDAAHTLRALKLTVDGEHVSMNFELQ